MKRGIRLKVEWVLKKPIKTTGFECPTEDIKKLTCSIEVKYLSIVYGL